MKEDIYQLVQNRERFENYLTKKVSNFLDFSKL